MSRPKWPQLRRTNPTDLKDHAVSLSNDFKSVQEFLQAGVSDVAPGFPKGIEHKIKEGIAWGLVQVEAHGYYNTYLSTQERDLISQTIFEEICIKTAPAFHNRVPQQLFTKIQDSYNDLYLKFVDQQNAASQREATMAGIASGNGIMPQTPPLSPLDEIPYMFSIDCESDTDNVTNADYQEATNRLRVRASKLKAHLQEVEQERKAVSQRFREKARKIRNEIQAAELEEKTAEKRRTETLKRMEVKRLEEDKTGDYGTEAVGYDVEESEEFRNGKRNDDSRCLTLKIENQAVVNRLFNMPANVLKRKVCEAVWMVDAEWFTTSTGSLGAELLDDGNVTLWVKHTDDYPQKLYENDAFDDLHETSFWDQAIIGSFASHLTKPYETYPVVFKDIPVEIGHLQDRKRQAAVISKLVKHNVNAIPSLHIDVIKGIHFSGPIANNKTRGLVLDFSDAATANDIILHGLQWKGVYYPCEVHDIKFFDRCRHCQAYGHHQADCRGPPRCGICTERHRTKSCKSSSTKCVLCDGPHVSGSPCCRAHKARLLDKHNARFPIGQNAQPDAVPSTEPNGAILPLCSTATQLPTSQIRHSDTPKERLYNAGPMPVRSTFSFELTPSAQQVQDRVPALQADLQSIALDTLRGRKLDFQKTVMSMRPAQLALPLEEEDEIL